MANFNIQYITSTGERATIASNASVFDFLEVNVGGLNIKNTGGRLDVGTVLIRSAAVPVSGSDLVNKAYADSLGADAATAGAGGGTLGVVTADTDRGLDIDGTGVIFAKVDGASLGYTGGGSLEVSDAGITEAKLATDAVTEAKIQSAAVTENKIAGNAVTENKIANNAVTNAKIAPNAVTRGSLADGAVGPDELDEDSVTSAHIVDDAVTGAKIADNAVATNHIADDAVTQDKLADNAVGTLQLADDAVTMSKIADDAVGSDQLADAAVQEIHLANDSVTASKIAASAVGAGLTGGGGTPLAVQAGEGIDIIGGAVSALFTRNYLNQNAGAITAGQIVRLTAGGVDLAVATDATLSATEIGVVADASIASGEVGAIIVRNGAFVSGYTGRTPGAKQYVSRATPGNITENYGAFVSGDMVYSVGRAVDATTVKYDPCFEFIKLY